MTDIVISAENVGKSYLIRHEKTGVGYRRLSEEIAEAVARPFRRLRHRANGSPAPQQPPTKERFWALKDVSFEVKRGEVLGIIGRNGAGKSTLLKILSRITEPTEGRVRIRGRVASLLEVGTGFHPELTGRENIFLNGTILGMSRREIQRKFDEIVAFAEIEKFLDTPVKRYSSGMYVRLAFAVAAHLEPEILVVDEVLAVGDVQFQKKCLGKMQDVARQHGRTVLFVSHNMTAIENLCHQVCLISDGRVITINTAASTIEQYIGITTNRTLNKDGETDLINVGQTGTGDVVFEGLEITNASGKRSRSLRIGERARIRVRFRAVLDLSNLIIGIAIHDKTSAVVFATHWNDLGASYSVKRGRYMTSCELWPNYLRDGHYSISIGAMTGTTVLGHCSEADVITIEKVPDQTLANYDDRAGILFIPMKWEPPKPLSDLG